MSERKYIPIVHAATRERPDEADTIEQAESIAAALGRLGHASEVIAVGLDLSPLAALASRAPHCVFNLVEAIETDVRLAPFAAAALDRIGLPYTGARFETLIAVLSKVGCKQRLRAAGIATPAWMDGGKALPADTLVLVKSDCEHASVGIDAGSVVMAGAARSVIADRERRFGGRFFAEAFIDGREFNAAIIEGPDGPEVLPVPEILFIDYPTGKPRIVDYDAKWIPESFAYNMTPRRFGIEASDPRLARRLKRLALDCWTLFGMSGYGRIDMRVDAAGKPWVIDININPCLTPDAGFAATAAAAGLSYERMIERILQAATANRAGDDRQAAGMDRPAAVGERGRRLRSSSPAFAVAVGLDAGTVGPAHVPTGGPEGLRAIPGDGLARAVDGRRSRPLRSKLMRPVRTVRAAELDLREAVRPEDAARVRGLVAATGLFTAEEVAIAGELVETRVAEGARSGYEFVLAEAAGELVGYTCFGRIAGSEWAYDLYWIAVAKDWQGCGVGTLLLRRSEELLTRLGCRQLYVDTSSTEAYAAARAFYERHGYAEVARLPDFYRAGDGKVIYAKVLAATQTESIAAVAP